MYTYTNAEKEKSQEGGGLTSSGVEKVRLWIVRW